MWTRHPTLTWNDFKGQPPGVPTIPSAMSNTGFRYQLICTNGMLDVNAYSFFSPGGSWVKPDQKTAELLKHEQGHYDMAEVYALRSKEAVRNAKVSCDDRAKASAAGVKIEGEWQQNWGNAERQYEESTKFGTDVAKQDAASAKIAADLAAMNASH